MIYHSLRYSGVWLNLNCLTSRIAARNLVGTDEIHNSALVIVSATTIYYVLRIAYCVLRIAYCVKYKFIYVTFNNTVQEHISRGLAETMIMAGLRCRLGWFAGC